MTDQHPDAELPEHERDERRVKDTEGQPYNP